MDQLARGIEVGAERYRMQKEQEKKNSLDAYRLLIEQEDKIIGRLPNIIDMVDKYGDKAPGLYDILAKNMEALEVKFDKTTYTGAKEAKENLKALALDKLTTAMNDFRATPDDKNLAAVMQKLGWLPKLQVDSKTIETFTDMWKKDYNTYLESKKSKPAGFDDKGKPVYEIGGKYMYGPNQPYEGGPLQPTTKEAQAPTYRVFNNQLLELSGGKPKVIAKGNTYQLALSSAMKDPDWEYSSEAEQAELINKHMRFQKGETRPTPEGEDYGPSDQPEGTTASNKEGVKIVTKNGKWVKM
jgi:hypothetical protein